MINGSLVWSGLVVETLLAIFFICWFAIFIYRYNVLKKFKANGGKVMEKTEVYILSTILFSFSLAAYLISLITGILFLINLEAYEITNRTQGLLFEIFFLIYILVIFVFFVILLIYQNTIILVFKNETLITLNNIIDAKSIVQIRRDNKRHWIFINWKDEKQKRIREIKLRYSYKVKDYLKENGLWQEQEPIK